MPRILRCPHRTLHFRDRDRPETHPPRATLRLAQLFAALALTVAAGAVAGPPELRFRIDEGLNINSFVRESGVAAHLLLRSGPEPRILVAFPAGDSGVGVWFAPTDHPIAWKLLSAPRALDQTDGRGRRLRGIEAEVALDAAALKVKQVVLSSVRMLREYERLGVLSPELAATAHTAPGRFVWSRDRVDGAAGYALSIEALDGARVEVGALRAATGAALRFKVRAVTGEEPLHALTAASLFTRRAGSDVRARNVLEFLSYREKFLAGSWRFDTYFGRDTLMSLALLAPVLDSIAVASGLASVLVRLAADGQVAHEEDIGEWAVLRNLAAGRGPSARPIYDYGMVDESFMLAPVAAAWLLDGLDGRARAAQFLAAHEPSGTLRGEALTRNLLWVVGRAAPFARQAVPTRLVGLKPGRTSGNWRDSDDGLGGGRYPYDVNAVFVPAALRATDRLLRSRLLDPYLVPSRRATLSHARAYLRVWSREAPPLFVVSVPAAEARADVAQYAPEAGVTASAPLAALDAAALSFNALALDAAGRPVRIMHSDDGFALLFGTPTTAGLGQTVRSLMRPFPAGLMTPIGLLVANPAFATRELRARFSRDAYHGTVVWSWQQAVFAAGLDRQLRRADIPVELRAQLTSARAQLWAAIDAAGELRTSELWSWTFADGCYRAEPFGQSAAHADESNAAQLWSTVFLALSPPPGAASGQTRCGS